MVGFCGQYTSSSLINKCSIVDCLSYRYSYNGIICCLCMGGGLSTQMDSLGLTLTLTLTLNLALTWTLALILTLALALNLALTLALTQTLTLP